MISEFTGITDLHLVLVTPWQGLDPAAANLPIAQVLACVRSPNIRVVTIEAHTHMHTFSTLLDWQTVTDVLSTPSFASLQSLRIRWRANGRIMREAKSDITEFLESGPLSLLAQRGVATFDTA